MNKLTALTSQPIALAAAITLAVAAVTAMTMPTPTAAPTAEPSGDTNTTPGMTPAAYNGFCSAIGAVPGDPDPVSCTRIPVTVLPAAYGTTTAAEVTR